MKYLYLLGSVLRSWFTVQRKFTLSAMLMFFFSSFIMLFVAAAMGNDVLDSSEVEEWAESTYNFYMSNDFADRTAPMASEDIFDTLFSLESNGIDYISVRILNDSDSSEKIGKKSVGHISIMPVLKENYGDNLFFSMLFMNSSSSLGLSEYLHVPYSPEQNIKEGSEITYRDLEEGKSVIVLPEEYGVNVGERVDLFGVEFLVVGITTDQCARIPSSFLEKFTLEDTGLRYLIYEIDFDKPITDETFEAFNQAVYKAMGKEIAVCELAARYRDSPKMAYYINMIVIGSVIALFSVFGIYYTTLRLCKETMPMLYVFKLCGMRTLPSFGLLIISVFICFAVSFGFGSLALILSEGFFARALTVYELRSLYFGISAIIFIFIAIVAMFPPLISLAKSQPAEEVEK